MALRHILLFKLVKKEDASICVEELKKLRESLKPHVPILSFIISETIGFVPSLLLISFLSTTEFVSLGEGYKFVTFFFGRIGGDVCSSVVVEFPECFLSSLVELEERF